MAFKTTILTAAVVLLLCGPLTAGELYYWIDENGVKQFSNQPPTDVPAGKVETSPEVTGSKATPPVGSATRSVKPSTSKAEDEAAASSSKKSTGPMQRQLLQKRETLSVTYDTLTKSAQSIKAARQAVPRNPRHLYRKRNRLINEEVLAHNEKVAAYNREAKAFNDDPIRIKYQIEELPEKELIPYPKMPQ